MLIGEPAIRAVLSELQCVNKSQSFVTEGALSCSRYEAIHGTVFQSIAYLVRTEIKQNVRIPIMDTEIMYYQI